ncbi:HD domain-containing protein [Pseudenhygromyxa sp. WMMC2535]|uniref:HD domain-containing protein n=1 Tax=Pseudenhygromyxa sp. WMMC2535 TaxID=2712867 RepID=UPI001555AF1A|nr:HD domain-containing protein [Pseudenhygromyxa sp. WMMC2535]NVB37769.1 HD domain-containing protein [Pseudenhygromyxa sp. WMMC2535]
MGKLRIRDAIHGDLVFEGELGELMRALIDTPIFQRLRHVHQNGLTHMVFPGAEHSRFVHSIGVAGVAQRMLDAIEANSGETFEQGVREATVVAALLHDVGHAPFSHTFEEIVGRDKFDHEKMGVRIIEGDEEGGLRMILECHRKGMSKGVADYIRGSSKSWAKAIVSSQLDADRLDYVRRDATLAGIDNLRPDITRLIENLTLYKDPSSGQDKVVVYDKAFDVVESVLLALDHLYGRVYFHKAVRAATVLLEALIRRAVEIEGKAFPDKSEVFCRLCSEGGRISLSDYVDATEATLWCHVSRWRRESWVDPVLHHLAKCLVGRKFPKTLELPYDNNLAVVDLHDKAINLVKEHYGEDWIPYLVKLDDSIRVNYRRFQAGAKMHEKEPIWLYSPSSSSENSRILAIEDEPRSNVRIGGERIYKGRLYAPKEVIRELRGYAERKKIKL